MCGARGHRNGKTRTSLSTTTMPQLTGPLKFRGFWPRTTWQLSPIPHTHPIWPPENFPLPQAEASDEGSKIWHHWRDSRWITGIQEGTTRDGSRHGRNAATAVFVQNGSTLKLMEEFNIQGNQTSFYKYCPGTFGYTLVYSAFAKYLRKNGNTMNQFISSL